MDKTVVTPKFLVPLSPAWFEWRIGSAKQGAADTAIDSRPFINCVRDIKEHKAWEHYSGFKTGPKTWERFCKEVLNTKAEFVDQVELGVEALEADGHSGEIPEKLALEAANLRGKAGRPTKQEQEDNDANNIISFPRSKLSSTGVDYLTARLKRSHGEIYNRWLAGEYPSVRAAAIDAGIVREPTTVEKIKKLWLKMTPEEKEEFQIWATEQLCG